MLAFRHRHCPMQPVMYPHFVIMWTCTTITKIFLMHWCIASAAKLNLDWILELVFPWFALATVGHLAGAIHAPEIWGTYKAHLICSNHAPWYVGVCVILVHGSIVGKVPPDIVHMGNVKDIMVCTRTLPIPWSFQRIVLLLLQIQPVQQVQFGLKPC